MDTLTKHRTLRHAAPALSSMEAAARAADIVSSLASGQGSDVLSRRGVEVEGAFGQQERGARGIDAEDGSQLLGSAREVSGTREARQAVGGPATEQGAEQVYEYVTWFFSPEEEARRRAYLPLK